ncbi:topology modulation protein [Qipengyuania sediminis]|uniref:topology modulation protein n=1 Tax=Qipengyuania sediminis TaxID=1532023 RepID=UPI0010598D06|nr:topology modulation protein [Qipengyuania sediminis]
MIIGSPGAGKSTLARQIAAATELPLYHLDAEYWLPGWTERDPQDWGVKLTKLVEGTHWIIDGNYGATLEPRLAKADTVLWLDYPTATCLWRVVKRIAASYGRVRPDSAPGCPERLDLAFLLYIARFRSRKRPRTLRLLTAFDGVVLHFRRPAEASAWLGRLPQTD